MDDDDNKRLNDNSAAANFFNDKASSVAPSSGPRISFSRPQQCSPPPTTIQPSENRPPPSNRARRHFEREAQSLPPLFSQHPPGQIGHTNTPPISPLSVFSPRTGFPGPLLQPLRGGSNDPSRDGPVPLTPLSPMNFTSGLSSPMELPSPMFQIGATTPQTPDYIVRGSTAQFSPMDSDCNRRFDVRDLHDLNSIGFSRQFRSAPQSPSLTEPQERALPQIGGSTTDTRSQDAVHSLRNMVTSNTQGSPSCSEGQSSSQYPVHQSHANLSPEAFPESPMFHTGERHLLNIPGQLQRQQDIAYPSCQGATSSVFSEMPQNPTSPGFLSTEQVKTAYLSERSNHGISENLRCDIGHQRMEGVSAMSQERSAEQITAESDRMDVVEERQMPGVQFRICPSSGLRVLPHIIIDRPLMRITEVLQQKVVRSSVFVFFVQNLKAAHRIRGEDAIGGTVRRRSDLVKAVTNIGDYGYPTSDREDIHGILDTTPGLTRENVEYLKKIVFSQLETIKRGAREALYQFSIILVDQLRYRVMKKADILSLQCTVVDRFVVARNCLLEKYTQYVRSRRWIENMSTNQRRGCLSHQQNNILRMWLYRNFTDPYPDEEAKELMTKETGLSIEQVNNWLINARSRFWRPSMDYYDRSSLERKMGMLIRHRVVMSTEDKIKAASKSSIAKSRGKNRRQIE